LIFCIFLVDERAVAFEVRIHVYLRLRLGSSN
jgi:hypothetical protein